MFYVINSIAMFACVMVIVLNVGVAIRIAKTGIIHKIHEVIMHMTIAFICLVVIVLNVAFVSYGIIQNKVIKTDSSQLYIVTSAIAYGASDIVELSVEPKEKIMYPIHEYTQEELAEQEYFDSLELLAICVEAEAGNQDLMGKRLVVDVILNRVDSENFPNNITDVIEQPYQFTSYSDGNMERVWEPSDETFTAVKMELEHRYNSDVLFFTEGRYNPYCIPGFKYGAHYFGY